MRARNRSADQVNILNDRHAKHLQWTTSSFLEWHYTVLTHTVIMHRRPWTFFFGAFVLRDASTKGEPLEEKVIDVESNETHVICITLKPTMSSLVWQMVGLGCHDVMPILSIIASTKSQSLMHVHGRINSLKQLKIIQDSNRY